MKEFAEILGQVNGPFSLMGLALLVSGALLSIVLRRQQDRAARRLIVIGLLGLGSVALLGSFCVAIQGNESRADAATASPPPTATHVEAHAMGPGAISVAAAHDAVIHLPNRPPTTEQAP